MIRQTFATAFHFLNLKSETPLCVDKGVHLLACFHLLSCSFTESEKGYNVCAYVTALVLPWQEHLRVARGACAPLDHAGLLVETTDCVHKQPLTHACIFMHTRRQLALLTLTLACIKILWHNTLSVLM
jgi:hypothetical protein